MSVTGTGIDATLGTDLTDVNVCVVCNVPPEVVVLTCGESAPPILKTNDTQAVTFDFKLDNVKSPTEAGTVTIMATATLDGKQASRSITLNFVEVTVPEEPDPEPDPEPTPDPEPEPEPVTKHTIYAGVSTQKDLPSTQQAFESFCDSLASYECDTISGFSFKVSPNNEYIWCIVPLTCATAADISLGQSLGEGGFNYSIYGPVDGDTYLVYRSDFELNSNGSEITIKNFK